jgi:hypothetical protein
LYAGHKTPLNRLVTIIAFTGVMFAGTRAHGDESAGQSRMNRRHGIAQVVVCMKKRMSNDRGTSYNEAKKMCTEQIAKLGDNASSGALVASAAPSKP